MLTQGTVGKGNERFPHSRRMACLQAAVNKDALSTPHKICQHAWVQAKIMGTAPRASCGSLSRDTESFLCEHPCICIDSYQRVACEVLVVSSHEWS